MVTIIGLCLWARPLFFDRGRSGSLSGDNPPPKGLCLRARLVFRCPGKLDRLEGDGHHYRVVSGDQTAVF